MNNDVKSDKDRLRQRFRVERRDGFIPMEFTNLADIAEIKVAQVIASYYSYGDEPVTNLINQELIAAGKTLLLPCINGDQMIWVKWDGENKNLDQSKKITEPIGEPFLDLAAIDVVLVPALRMDSDGYRLGQGGGFYDRALPLLRAHKHGVVYPYERMEYDLPREPWDIPVDSW